MLLYHFTPIKNLEAIRRDGLQAWCSSDHMAGLLRRVVWLCDTPTVEFADWELAIFKERCPEKTVRSKRWLGTYDSDPLARLTVRLSSDDRKLKKYGPWLRKHQFVNHPDPDDISLRGARWRRGGSTLATSPRRKSSTASSSPRRCSSRRRRSSTRRSAR